MESSLPCDGGRNAAGNTPGLLWFRWSRYKGGLLSNGDSLTKVEISASVTFVLEDLLLMHFFLRIPVLILFLVPGVSIMGTQSVGESIEGTQPMQYFKPDKYFVGDCMPFFHEGVFHLYYLQDENHHGSREGRGGHQWAHATTRDLVHWEHHPLAIGITDDWEGSICTGSTFFWDGLFYGFYATRKMDWSQHLSVATSKDGIHFEKTEPRLYASPEGPYKSGFYRDPCVFRDEKTGLFHQLVTGELNNPTFPGRGGCLAHLVSEDLTHWKTVEPFIIPGLHGQPECPNHFFWNGWYYLIFSTDGRAQYRMSRGPLGPWTRPRVHLFDSPMARVMKTAAFTGDRRIGAAFLPTLAGDKDGGGMQWAGSVMFREIVQDHEGLLWIKFPAEMMPKSGPPVELKPTSQPLGVTCGTDEIRVSAVGGMNALALPSCPVNVRITCEIMPLEGASEYGLGLRASTDYGQAYDLLFTPAREKVEIRPCMMGDIDENIDRAIYSVDGLEKPVRVEIIMKDDVIDVALETESQKRCLISRCYEQRGDHLFLFARDGEVVFRNLQICPLVEN